MTMAILRVAVLFVGAVTACMASESIHPLVRADGGYDYFSFDGTYLGQSVPNKKGSYDYYDGLGMFLGWSEARTSQSLDFFDAAGGRQRTIALDADGNETIYDDKGLLVNISARNPLGGIDNYDSLGNPTSTSLPWEYVVHVQDKKDE